MKLQKIISGGQTGADRGGLEAGQALGIETGGWAPRGWLTDDGPDPSLADFGLKEHESDKYPPRTAANVHDSDATILFGNSGSPGSSLTLKLCHDMGKEYFVLPYPPVPVFPRNVMIQDVRNWLEYYKIKVLNVAGNRERKNRGIRRYVREFLVVALKGDRG